ncbi:MAG: hypothetical protein U9N35_01930 [Euryarchaeota archaeon]|nr:hypothetical protein [Euryarchaeota archaeon]
MNLRKHEKEELKEHGYSDEQIKELKNTSMNLKGLREELKDIYNVPLSHMEQIERKVLPCPNCRRHTVFRKIKCEAFSDYFCSRCGEIKV